MGKIAKIPLNFITVSYLPPFDYEWYVDSGDFIQSRHSVIELFRKHVHDNYDPSEWDNLRIVVSDTHVTLYDNRIKVSTGGVVKKSLPIRQACLVAVSDWVDGDGNPIAVSDVLNQYFSRIEERIDYKILPTMVAKVDYDNDTLKVAAVYERLAGVYVLDHLELYRLYHEFIEFVETEFAACRNKAVEKFTNYNNFLRQLNVSESTSDNLEITNYQLMRMINVYFSDI